MTDTPDPSGPRPPDEATAAPTPPPGPPPPPGDAGAGVTGGFTTRYGLVRPQNGRFLAGVCAAIARATNTDPILWRVLLAVLSAFFAVGVLIYVAAWLIIPAEGDTASPIESVLGKGRSSMSPVTAIILGVGCAVLFGFIVTDAFRAVLLGAAILIGGALLLNRHQNGPAPVPSGAGVGAPGSGMSWSSVSPWAGSAPWNASPAPTPPATGAPAAPAPPPAAVDEPTRAYPPGPFPPPAYPPSTLPQQPAGYRPAFAPYGPYGGPPQPPPAPPRPPKPPKPPKERSALGAATFSMIFIAMGVVAMLDLLNVIRVRPTTYFAAALLTVALGLLVGTWLGRARWLIALGVAAAAALGISSIAEYQVDHDTLGPRTRVWAPLTINEVEPSYRLPFGDATLDLSRVDFTGQTKEITVTVNAGQLEVELPEDVDVTAHVDVDAGEARVLGRTVSGFGQPTLTVADAGDDGEGGGRLVLNVHVNTGDVEVTR